MLAVGAGSTQAAQVVYQATAVASTGNNFTMLTPSGALQGGDTTTDMTWDGTVFTTSSDYTGPGSTSNMTLTSTTAFSGSTWAAHDIQVFGPGNYTFDPTFLEKYQTRRGASRNYTYIMRVG